MSVSDYECCKCCFALGPFAEWIAQPFACAESTYAAIAIDVGCCSSVSSCNTSSVSVLQCLQAQSAQVLTDANIGLLSLRPVIDGVIVTDDPRTLLTQGKAANVPVLIGTNAGKCRHSAALS